MNNDRKKLVPGFYIDISGYDIFGSELVVDSAGTVWTFLLGTFCVESIG